MSGLEVIGGIASIAQLAATVYSISKTLYEVGDALSNAPSDIQDLARDLETFSEELQLYSTLLTGKNGRYGDQIYRLTAKIIGDCATICTKIDRILKKLRSGTVWARVKWLYKEKEILKLLARLKHLKLSLMSTLSVLSALKADYVMDLLGGQNSSLIESSKNEDLSRETLTEVEETRQKLAEISVAMESYTLNQEPTMPVNCSRVGGLDTTLTSGSDLSSTSKIPECKEPENSNVQPDQIHSFNIQQPFMSFMVQNPAAMESVQSFHSAVSFQDEDRDQSPSKPELQRKELEDRSEFPLYDHAEKRWRGEMVATAMRNFSMDHAAAELWAGKLEPPTGVTHINIDPAPQCHTSHKTIGISERYQVEAHDAMMHCSSYSSVPITQENLHLPAKKKRPAVSNRLNTGPPVDKRQGAGWPGKCHSCNQTNSPEWRRGPAGPGTLCNPCGLYYAKTAMKPSVVGYNFKDAEFHYIQPQYLDDLSAVSSTMGPSQEINQGAIFELGTVPGNGSNDDPLQRLTQLASKSHLSRPMSIPNSRESVPPPLAPPKYLATIADGGSNGPDIAWQWGNSQVDNGPRPNIFSGDSASHLSSNSTAQQQPQAIAAAQAQTQQMASNNRITGGRSTLQQAAPRFQHFQHQMQTSPLPSEQTLQGQAGGIGPAFVPQQPNLLMSTLNTLRNPSQQPFQQPHSEGGHICQSLEPRSSETIERPGIPNNAVPVMLAAVSQEQRQRLSQLPPEELSEIARKWYAVRQRNNANPQLHLGQLSSVGMQGSPMRQSEQITSSRLLPPPAPSMQQQHFEMKRFSIEDIMKALNSSASRPPLPLLHAQSLGSTRSNASIAQKTLSQTNVGLSADQMAQDKVDREERAPEQLSKNPGSESQGSARRRTKTGCLSCRRRRIKCSNEKPICQNCIKSKRQCEGYSQRIVFKDPLNYYRGSPPTSSKAPDIGSISTITDRESFEQTTVSDEDAHDTFEETYARDWRESRRENTWTIVLRENMIDEYRLKIDKFIKETIGSETHFSYTNETVNPSYCVLGLTASQLEKLKGHDGIARVQKGDEGEIDEAEFDAIQRHSVIQLKELMEHNNPRDPGEDADVFEPMQKRQARRSEYEEDLDESSGPHQLWSRALIERLHRKGSLAQSPFRIIAELYWGKEYLEKNRPDWEHTFTAQYIFNANVLKIHEDFLNDVHSALQTKDLSEPLITSINRISEIVEVLKTTVTLETGAIPWTCIFAATKEIMLAQEGKGDIEEKRIMLIKIADVATLVARYNILESMYQNWAGMTLERKYETSLITLSAHVLRFLANMIGRYRNPESTTFTLENVDRDFNKILEADKACRGFTVTIDHIYNRAWEVFENPSSDDSLEPDKPASPDTMVEGCRLQSRKRAVGTISDIDSDANASGAMIGIEGSARAKRMKPEAA